ncbi:hypothetical protein BDB00DRAFT_776043 [Zychaea mexicana]|uniref:uncharacterized protein n=1 Tax=Zychaea mexicana TaxID=64656 RepID=UPI0022FF06A2|nr:uncharacterized protein BDB00DRAFT_776043 [Zychaea mexicana]KAI9477082.1 hypothetical protein BDB00DRAFT_776043 [Zychaea mexicana]
MDTQPSTAKVDPKTAVAGVVDTVNRRVSGKAWKLQKTATTRSQKAKTLRNSWAKRSAVRTKINQVKALEKQMKDEKQAEKDVSCSSLLSRGSGRRLALTARLAASDKYHSHIFGWDTHVQQRKRAITLERKKIQEEKERMEALAAKVIN